MIEQTSSRNMDELKRLVLSSMDASGILRELRSTIKLQVIKAINEEPTQGAMSHCRNPKIASLMDSDRGQLLTELVMDFLRFYGLTDTMAMLQVEAALPRIRPSESEIASQCGIPFTSINNLSVLEQYLVQHQERVHYPPPHHDLPGDTQESSPLPPVRSSVPAQDSPVFKSDSFGGGDLSPPMATMDVYNHLTAASPLDESPVSRPVDTSLEKDMAKMRNISQEIERISLSSLAGGRPGNSPRYDQDEFDSEDDETPRPRTSKRADDADAVLFESRDSPLQDLGESPASAFPMDRNDVVEKVILRR